MSDFRVRYGMALGPYGSAGATSSRNLITPGDTTPDVSLGNFFVTANTSSTTISYFDVVGEGGIDSLANNGKVITILFQDNLTTIANAGQIIYAGTGTVFNSGQTVSFIYYNSAWYQYPNSAVVSPVAHEAIKTITVAGATLAPNVDGVSLLLVNNTAASTIVGLSGGSLGQKLDIAQTVAASGTGLTITAAANLQLAGTASFVFNGSAIYSFVCDNGSRFRQVSGAGVP